MPFDGVNVSPVARVLIDAKGFLERGWCTGTQGITAEGHAVPGRDPNAIGWCLYGAIMAATLDGRLELAAADMVASVLPKKYQGVGSGQWAGFNNSRKTVDPVLDVIDLAIAKAMKS